MFINALRELNVTFHQVVQQDKLPLRFVVRGLPQMTTDEELRIQGYQVNEATKIEHIKPRNSGTPSPYKITLSRTEKNEKFIECQQLFNITIKCSRWLSRRAGQCQNCGRFTHESELCKQAIRCFHCSDNHVTMDCPHKTEYEPKCGNCAQNHNMDSAECKVLQAYRLSLVPQNSSKTNRRRRQPPTQDDPNARNQARIANTRRTQSQKPILQVTVPVDQVSHSPQHRLVTHASS